MRGHGQVSIRLIKEADLEKVIAIQGRITRRPVGEHWRRMVAAHVGGGDRVGFVADLGGEVAGFIIGEIKVGQFGTELAGWIEMVGITPEHMGEGLGQSLAQHLLTFFREQGVSEVLTSVKWDSGDLLAFFKGLGFDRSPFIMLQVTS